MARSDFAQSAKGPLGSVGTVAGAVAVDCCCHLPGDGARAGSCRDSGGCVDSGNRWSRTN